MNLAAKYALQEAPFHVADFDYLFGEIGLADEVIV